MNIVLATGIYPPDIGGPATYTSRLASEFTRQGHDVKVIAYEPMHNRTRETEEYYQVIDVSRSGSTHKRWSAFADALTEHAADADIVQAFSSVSCGVPLQKAKLTKPKRVLRLGGDFFWERYTDKGGMKGLADWYRSWNWRRLLTQRYMQRLLQSFDHIVFSTHMQQTIYGQHYPPLPSSVIENAVPSGSPIVHKKHEPFRVLFMGRFVNFKNLPALIDAMQHLPNMTLTLVGEGPASLDLIAQTSKRNLNDRVTFLSPVHDEEKRKIISDHDLLVIPSVTEISPNAALEARSAGLPVLLTDKTGLSEILTSGMSIRTLRTSIDIVDALRDAETQYADLSKNAAAPVPGRSWNKVAEEHLTLYQTLL